MRIKTENKQTTKYTVVRYVIYVVISDSRCEYLFIKKAYNSENINKAFTQQYLTPSQTSDVQQKVRGQHT